jgi:hypothetical protein
MIPGQLGCFEWSQSTVLEIWGQSWENTKGQQYADHCAAYLSLSHLDPPEPWNITEFREKKSSLSVERLGGSEAGNRSWWAYSPVLSKCDVVTYSGKWFSNSQHQNRDWEGSLVLNLHKGLGSILSTNKQ